MVSSSRRKYSKDIKEVVIYQSQTLERSTTQIAKDLNIPLRVVQRILSVWREFGQVVRTPDPSQVRGRPRLLTRAAIDVSYFCPW